MSIPPCCFSSSESPSPASAIDTTPVLDEIPVILVNPLTEKRALRRELEPFLAPNGRISHAIAKEIPEFSMEQYKRLAWIVSSLEPTILLLKSWMRGLFIAQWVGGGVRDIFYRDPSFLHTILKILNIPQPERYNSLFDKYSRRRVPDTDIRIWLQDQDVTDMPSWTRFLSSQRRVNWHDYHCSEDADYAIAICPVATGDHDVEFLFTNRLKRETLFTHELMINIDAPLKEGLQFATRRPPKNGSKQELDPNEFWQAVFDLLTRRLHVNGPEEVNFEGLPILISYYVRGWTLGDAEVESIFLKKFINRAQSEGGITKSFMTHFRKTWKKHHFSDPEAAIALAFNFCATAKGMEGVNDAELLSIMREVYHWFSGKNPQGQNILSSIKGFISRAECTLESLFDWVYTQGILTNISGNKANGALLDHWNGEAFQLEFSAKNELLHLLLPKQLCHISFKESERAFFQMNPSRTQAEELGVHSCSLWEQAKALWSVEKKSRSQVNRGCGTMILSLLLQPSTEKELTLLRRLPLMMAAQSDEEFRFALLVCLQNAFRETYPNLMQQSEQHLKEPFDGGIFLFEWIKILALRVEGPLRNISWDLWNLQAPKKGKGRVKKELELFELYFPHDLEKSLKLFSCFCPSLQLLERLKYWRRLYENPQLLKAPIDDLYCALENIGTIPSDSNVDKRFYAENFEYFRLLMKHPKPDVIYPLMKQGLSNGLLHRSCPKLNMLWFELCCKLLPISPENAYEALEIGTKKCLFVTPPLELLDFKLELAESLQNTGFRESAAALIQSIRKMPKLKKEVYVRLQAIEENEFQKQFECLELKKPEAVMSIFSSWLQFAEKGVVDLKTTSSLSSYYNNRQDHEILSTIVCHSTTAKLFKLNFEVFSDLIFHLVQRCDILKKGTMILKVFFDFFESFEREQQKIGLLAAYAYLSEKGERIGKLPGSIKNHLLKNAAILMEESHKPLSCFSFLKEIDCQFRPDFQAWTLLVKDVAVEKNQEQLYKVILEFKSAGAPLIFLDPLVQRLLEHPGPETISQIRQFFSWETPPLEADFSKPLIAYLHTLDPNRKAQRALLDKDLLERLIPRDDLKRWVQDIIQEVYDKDVEETLILADKYRFIDVALLQNLLGKVIESNQRHLKLKVRDFCCKALQDDDFELEGDPKIKADCWESYLSLCAEFGDRGMVRFLYQSINEKSPFSRVLKDLDPEFKIEILGSVAIAILRGAANEQEIEALLPIIDQVMYSNAPSQGWIEALVSGYLICSSPQIFLVSLRHLVKLQSINDPEIFPAVFTRFASIAEEYDDRDAVHQLIREVYEKAESDPRFSNQIPFASSIFEAVSKSHSKLLIDLAKRLFLQVGKKSEWDAALQLSIKKFLLSLLDSKDPERQALADQLIKVDFLDKLLERELIGMLRHNTLRLKMGRVFEAQTELAALKLLLDECLDSFAYVQQTGYQLSTAQFFMLLLAKYNAASPSPDGATFYDYLKAYAACLNHCHANSPIPIDQDDPQKGLELFLHCSGIELLAYTGIVDKMLLPSQVFVLESVKMSFTSYENRIRTLDFIMGWLQIFIQSSIDCGCLRKPTVEAYMVYAVVMWINGLSITQIYDHIERIDSLLMFSTANSILIHQPDLMLLAGCMVFPKKYMNPSLNILSQDPGETPLINTFQKESKAYFSHLIMKLTETLEPASFCWGLIVMQHLQNIIFKDHHEDYNRFIEILFINYKACFLQHPRWHEKTFLYEDRDELFRQESSLAKLIRWVIHYRLEELKRTYGDNADKYAHPIISKYLRLQIDICDDLFKKFDLETSCIHCLNTGTRLNRRETCSAFLEHSNEYWQIVELFVDKAIKLLKDPAISLVYGKDLSIMFLIMFTGVGGLSAPPFSRTPLDKISRKIKLRLQLKIIPVIVEYRNSMSIPDAQIEIYLKNYKRLAQSTLLDGMKPRQKKEFLDLLIGLD